MERDTYRSIGLRRESAHWTRTARAVLHRRIHDRQESHDTWGTDLSHDSVTCTRLC